MRDPWGDLRRALQAVLDEEGDGWLLAHYVAVLGIERVSAADIKTSVWIAVPNTQPDYVIDGLLKAATDLRDTADIEDD